MSSESSLTPTKKRKVTDSFAVMLDEGLDDPALKSAMKEIVAELLNKPAKILFCHAKVTSDDLIPKARASSSCIEVKGDADFHKEYHTYGLVPKEPLLLKHC
eukprot:11273692-Prorocentrum_lima.AAC.1